MRKMAKTACVAAIATAALAMLVGVTQARRFSISSFSTRMVWQQMRFSSGLIPISCDVTLEGTLHERNITKRFETLVGYITRAEAEECSGGQVTLLTETLPWHTRYSSFSGTLPNITSMNLITQFRIQIRPTGQMACLAETTNIIPAIYSLVLMGSEVIEVFWATAGQLPLNMGCLWGTRLRLFGSGSVTVLGGASRVSISLI